MDEEKYRKTMMMKKMTSFMEAWSTKSNKTNNNNYQLDQRQPPQTSYTRALPQGTDVQKE